MQLKIKYFGMLAEVAQCREEDLHCNEVTVYGLLKVLYGKYPKLKEKNFQIAQNNELLSPKAKLTTGEIALLPPFAGG